MPGGSRSDAATDPVVVPDAAMPARPWPGRLVGALVALPMLLMAIGAWAAWGQAWAEARAELVYTADATAQLGLRILSAHAAAAGRINEALRGQSDADIRAGEAVLHDRLRAMVRDVPQAEASFVIDRQGQVLVASSIFPVPRDAAPARDREFFLALQDPETPVVHVSPIYRGRLDDKLFFAISRRREATGNADLPPGGFDGLVNLPAYPNLIAEDLRTLTARPPDVLSLLRADGEVLARSSGLDAPARIAPDSAVGRVLADAPDWAIVQQVPLFSAEPHLFALRRVAGWPIYATAGRPRGAILADWRGRVLRQMAIGVPATAALIVLTILLGRSQRAAAMQAGRLQALFETEAVAIAETDAEGRFTAVNCRFCALVGWPREALLAGMGFGDLTPPEEAPPAATLRAAPRGHEKRYLRRDGSSFWGACHAALRRDAAGRATHLVSAIQDISDRKAAEAQNALMIRELDHRAKNLLAVVQALVRLTPATDLPSFVAAVEGRLAALARAHNLLAADRWQGASLHRLVAAELAGFAAPGPPRVVIEGPPVRLLPAAAQGLGMVLHELATNAAKHGALSRPEGVVRLGWQVDRTAGLLRLDWREAGGPVLDGVPARAGFGTRLVLSTLQTQLGGGVNKVWAADGLVCAITLPLGRVVAGG